MSRAILRLESVSKRYGHETVLQNVSFTAIEGQVTVILGPSGSGKSTLLRCINALEPYQEGRIDLDGQTLPNAVGRWGWRRQRSLQRLRSQVGMVFQGLNLFPHRTAEENVMLAPMRVNGLSHSDAALLARNQLEQVGLRDKAKAYPSQLSGGQQQRVAIARALAMQPRILLLDEVTSALDPELVNEVLAVIRSLVERGTTMLIVTHEMAFASEVADNVVFMDKGSVVEWGAASEVLTQPRTERLRTFLQR